MIPSYVASTTQTATVSGRFRFIRAKPGGVHIRKWDR
jgi:hypothetical protein